MGTTYPIAETDLLTWIQSRLQRWQQTGELKQWQEAFKQKSMHSIQNPKPVMGAHKTTNPRSYTFDPSITVPQDLKDHQGNVFHKGGTKINPLSQVSLTSTLLFIDGDDLEQQAWAEILDQKLAGKTKLVLVKGSPIDLMKQASKSVYFDQQGFLVKNWEYSKCQRW